VSTRRIGDAVPCSDLAGSFLRVGTAYVCIDVRTIQIEPCELEVFISCLFRLFALLERISTRLGSVFAASYSTLAMRAPPQARIVLSCPFPYSALPTNLLVETQTHPVPLTPLKLHPVLRISPINLELLPVHFTQCDGRQSFTTRCELELELPSTAGMRIHVGRSGSLYILSGS
jgi:hypothetical protein